jgi:hypothetical protein
MTTLPVTQGSAKLSQQRLAQERIINVEFEKIFFILFDGFVFAFNPLSLPGNGRSGKN